MENLAPAGNREALEKAVAAGADAVYLGYAAFSARAGAGNFTEDELRDAVAYAHLHHVRVHVTVNTLIKDSELADVVRVLALLNEIPVDAVLIQDLGVLSLCRAMFPDLPVHASTQMSIHNAVGAEWCRSMGMHRVVLARECSLSEIARCAALPIEIEVFGHGAQCVGVSGQCLFSSMAGNRSGNRGRCAQPCRMQYDYRGRTAAWLSPRDVCLRADIDALKNAGVASLKLEGRLKRPEYVAIVAGSYRRGLDGQPADAAELAGLKQIFQRGGFMRGYAMGCEDAGVIAPDRVNHGGMPLGRVRRVLPGKNTLAVLTADVPLHNEDELQFRTASGDQEMIYAGPGCGAGEEVTVRLRPGMTVRPGDEVYRLTDAEQLAQARAIKEAPIPADMALYALPGQPLMLTVTDGESTVCVTGDTVQKADARPLNEESARRSLQKTGDTPFVLRELTLETESAFVPAAALNALRRDALSQLADARSAAFGREPGRTLPEPTLSLPGGAAKDTVIFRTPGQYTALSADGGDRLYVWYPEDFRSDALERMLTELPEGIWLRLPTVCEQQTLLDLQSFVTRHAGHIAGVMLGSVGQLGLSWPVPMAAGPDIPVMNRHAAGLLYRAGCTFVTASCELSGAEQKALCQGIPALIPAWGRTQMMLLHHCPARTALGLTAGHARCDLCDRHAPEALQGTALTDRKGFAFPLLRQRLPEGCLVRLMNALPTDNTARIGAYPTLTEFTDETPDTIHAVMDGRYGSPVTAGHWRTGVE